MTRPAPAAGIARAALLIACVTIAARLAGFARVIVFTRIVGPSCLGDTYFTANTVPNIVFDIVAGGALSSLVVPVLAGPVAAGDRSVVDRTTSALLTWAASILVPMTLLGMLFTRPLIRVLVGHGHAGCSASAEVAVGARMLEVFMPQVLLYGMAVVLIGVLQAHRQFLGGALGPLVSSLVVIAAYATFGFVALHRETDLSTLTRSHELILSVGTTLGVAALLFTLLFPAMRTGIQLRPTYRFPPGVATTIRNMAISGAVVVGSQDIATGVVLRLANAHGTDGTVVLYNLAWTVFTVPWAVAAVPLATSAFPGLTASWQCGDKETYRAATARTARVMIVVVAATAAVMGAAAGPMARVVVLGAPGGVAPTVLARGLATFAPGLVGYAFVALLSRALYAQNNAKTPATAIAVGWLVAIVADIALVAALPASWTVAAFGIGTTIGVSVSGAWLLVALHQSAGVGALAGLPHAAAAAVVGGLAGTAAGGLLARAVQVQGLVGDLAIMTAVAGVAVIVHTAVVAVLDRPTLTLLLKRGGSAVRDSTDPHLDHPLVSVLLTVAKATGGIGRHVRTLAAGLPDRGVEVTVCAPVETITALELDALSCRVVAAPIGSTRPGAARACRRILQREAARVDLAHAHGLRAGADCVAFLKSKPLIVTWHNAPQGGLAWRAFHEVLTRYVARGTDLTLAASDDLAADARAAGGKLVRSTFVASPTLPAPGRSVTAIRAELGVGDRHLVLAVGRLQRQKRLEVLVAAAAGWVGQPDAPVVVIAGDGPDRPALEAQIVATNAPVTLLGNRGDIADLLSAADVVALPSEWEARSLVAQEALRAGVPLVSTGVGGLTALVGDAAIIVAVGDADALRTAIDEVLANPQKRERMVAAGRARVRSWSDEQGSVDDLVGNYLDLMRRVRLQ